jgi:hypothetical protein
MWSSLRKLGPAPAGVQGRAMARRCEICETLNPNVRPATRLQRFLVKERVVALCTEHADAFREQRPETLEQLSRLFREGRGRRSLLSRRAPIERRQFPMRPEGRRHNTGRRAGDVG